MLNGTMPEKRGAGKSDMPSTDRLRGVPLLASLADDEADRYARQCAWRSYDENELVIDFEDRSTDVRFLASGRLRVILRLATGREMILTEIADGAHFGEIAAIDGAPRSANVTALGPSRVAIMPQSVFHEMLARHPEVNTALLARAGLARSRPQHAAIGAFLPPNAPPPLLRPAAPVAPARARPGRARHLPAARSRRISPPASARAARW